MLILIRAATTKKITKKYLPKEMREKWKWHTRKYLLIKNEGSNGENEEQKDKRHVENNKLEKKITLSVITVNVTRLNYPIKR